MGKIRRIIPFGFWPAHWGLSGSTRARMHAEYYLDGEDLAYRLLDIDYPDISDKEYDWAMEYRTAKLKLDYRYHKVGEFDYGLGIIENDARLTETDRQRQITKYLHKFGRLTAEETEYQLFEVDHEDKESEAYIKGRLKLDVKYGKKDEEAADHELLNLKFEDKNSIEYKIAQSELELKWGNITQNQHEKEVATLLREPWFNVIGADQSFSGENVKMAIELDWNEFFIQFLESKGWTGITPDEIVDRWFESAMKQMMNLDDLDSLDDGSSDPMPMAGNRTRRDDGLTEYR